MKGLSGSLLMHLSSWGEVVIFNPRVLRPEFSLVSNDQMISRIRALGHIIRCDSSLLIRHLDLRLSRIVYEKRGVAVSHSSI